jgi:hypothetical protein
MLIRSNPNLYRPGLTRDHRGLLLITRRWIIATGMFARCYQA